MLFRLIGGAVVYGFALYGVTAFLDRPRVRVFLAEGRQEGGAHGKVPGTQQKAPPTDSPSPSA